MLKNDFLIRIKERWAELSHSEKRTVSIGAFVVALFLFYMIIWSPLVDRAAKVRKQVVNLQHTLAWMQQADKKLDKSKGEVSADSGVSLESPAALLGYLQKQLQTAGLNESVTQLKQASQEGVSLQFKEVSFDELIAFLQKALTGQSVSIQQMSVKALAAPGMVEAQILLVLS